MRLPSLYSFPSNALWPPPIALYPETDKASLEDGYSKIFIIILVAAAAAAAAKSLQSCPTLCDPIDGSPPGSPVPGILQARTLEWVAISFNA